MVEDKPQVSSSSGIAAGRPAVPTHGKQAGGMETIEQAVPAVKDIPREKHTHSKSGSISGTSTGKIVPREERNPKTTALVTTQTEKTPKLDDSSDNILAAIPRSIPRTAPTVEGPKGSQPPKRKGGGAGGAGKLNKPSKRTEGGGQEDEDFEDDEDDEEEEGDPEEEQDEMRYCYCNQVSYGKMVACDGDNCQREWFHLPCVGLTHTPSTRGKLLGLLDDAFDVHLAVAYLKNVY